MTSPRPSLFPVVILVLAAFLLGVLGVRFLGYLNRDQPTVEDKRSLMRLHARQKIEAEDALRLNSVGWADEANGVAHIPISRAMELVVAELNQKAVGPSDVPVVLTPPPAAPVTPEGAQEEATPAEGEETPDASATPDVPQGEADAVPETEETPQAAAAPEEAQEDAP